MKKHLILALTVIPCFLSSCASSQAQPDKTATRKPRDLSSTVQKVARPHEQRMSCPMNYSPVCATIEENGKQVFQTFGNSCTAHISGKKVISIKDGACSASN